MIRCSLPAPPGSDAIRRAMRPPRSPICPDIVEITAEPRLYGFHATLKPPMRLAQGRQWFDVLGAAQELADRTASFELPRLRCRICTASSRCARPSRARRCRRWRMRAWNISIRSAPHRPTPNCAPPPRQADRRAGCDAGALGLSLRVRDMVLPHDADAALERPRRRRVPARGGGIFRPCPRLPR